MINSTNKIMTFDPPRNNKEFPHIALFANAWNCLFQKKKQIQNKTSKHSIKWTNETYAVCNNFVEVVHERMIVSSTILTQIIQILFYF